MTKTMATVLTARMPLKIDKTIPIPAESLSAQIRAALKAMKPGDSILLSRANEVYRHAKAAGVAMRGHKVDGGYRFWRVR